MTFALVVGLSALSGVASADEAAVVDALYDRGLQQARGGQHLEAGATFLEAYALDPNPSLLWNAARSFEAGGDTAQARALFERYAGLEDAKPEKATQAREWLAANAPVTPPRVVVTDSPTEPPAGSIGPIVGWTLCGTGIAALVGGGLSVIFAAQSRDDTYKLVWGDGYTKTLERHDQLRGETQARELAGWITLGLAAGLLGSGLAVLLSGGDEGSEFEATPAVSLTPLPGGLSAAGTWRF